MSFADKKGIVVASGFKLQAEALLDARQQVDTIAERDELVTINAATPGLRVYVKETKRNYVYNGTGWDTLAQGDGVAALPFTPSTSNTSAGVTEMLEIADEWVKNRDKLYYKLNEEGNPYNLYTLFDNRDVYAGVEGGKYQIDCSSFVHAVLMGIRYKNSRYALCVDTNEQHNSTTGYPHNISSRKWAYSLFENANDPYLQGTPQTYRYANQIAKYAYEHGFAFKITSDGKNLQYGDLIFLYENDEWDSDGYAGESWNGIYHVAIYCGKNISGYLRMVGAVSPNNSNATSPLDYTYIDPNSEYIWGAARFPLAESANVDFAERNILLGGKGDFEQTNVYKFRLTEPTKAGEWYTAVLSADRLVDATITLSLRDTDNQNVNIGYYTSSIGQPVQSKYDGLYIMSFQATKETSEVWLFSGDGNAPTSENMLLHYLCLYKGLVDPPSIYTRPQAELPDIVYAPTEFLSSESSELDGDTALEEFIRSHIDNTEFSTKLYNIRITSTTVINPGRYFTKIKVSSVGYMVVANLLGVNGHYDITIDQEDNYEIIDLRTTTTDRISDFEDAVQGLIPEIPTKLPNPQALTFTGAVTGTYDGSTAKTINIPTTGSTDGSLIVKLNGGSTEGTNMFTFNGSADKTVNITPSAIGAAASSHSHGLASTTAAGFLKQLSGSTSQFMRADGNWATPPNTTYSAMKGATSSAAGAAGLVPAPAAGYQSRWLRGDGTWQSISLSTLGVSATAAELNYMDGVTSNVQTQLNSKAASSHTHNYAGSASAGGAANSVKASLIVKLNGGTTEGTNMFTFNGGTEKTINITPSAIGAAAASHGTHVTYSTSAPKANGTASAGSAASVSRSDHVHPLQTTVSGNAGSATKLATARTIDGVSFNGTANITHFGTCSTAAGTAAKVVSCTGFTLASGAKITVKFTITNTAANPTLNVNNTGAKAIMYRGAAISAGYLAANRVYTFIYDGTDYELIGDINTDTNTTYGTGTSSTPGLTKLYTGTGANTDGTMTQDAITDALAGKAASSHNHSASNITSGTLPIARGGTGLTASPSMLVNLGSTSAASIFTTSPRPGVTGTLPIARGGTGATSASAARTALGAAASSHTHNYAGSSSAGGAATSAVKVSVPVGTVLFSTSSSTTFFSSCFGGTWTVVGNIDAIVGSSSTLTLYMFRKTAA